MGIFRKLFGWIANRWVISILGILLVCLLIWFIGPLVAIAGAEPLASPTARLVVILIVVLAWGIYNAWQVVRARRSNARMMDGLAVDQSGASDLGRRESEEELALLRDRFRDALGILKKAKLGGRGRRRHLYQLPWYLIIGPPGAGKTTALKNSGLKFPLTERFGDDAIGGIGGTRNCDWWFTDEAVLLDTAGRYTTQDSDETVDSAAWTGFMALLRRYRRRRPIDGVIVAFGISDLIRQSDQERALHARAVRQRLQELLENLKLRVPVYVVFTKCDLVAGFVEFFDDLGREARGQVWGVTFPIERSESADGAIEAYGPEFDRVMARLDGRLAQRLADEGDINRRGAILGFTQQMGALKPLLQDFLGETFKPSRFEQPVLLRGVYFSSGTQEGTPIDRVIGSISRSFGLDAQAMPAFSGPGRSYFLNHLLREVVFREADLVGATGFLQRHRAWLQRLTYAGGVVAVAALAGGWLTSYLGNQNLIAEVETEVAAYRETAEQSVSAGTLLDLLPSLDAMRALPGGYAERDQSAPILRRFGLYQGDKLGEAARGAYRRVLNSALLPRVTRRLEEQMVENVDRTEVLYETLKVYLMLGLPQHLDRDFVAAWLALDWENRLPGPGNAATRAKLDGHFQAMLEMDLPPAHLDAALVDEARRILAQRPIAARVYGQIRQATIDPEAAWRVTDKIGPDVARYFRRTDAARLEKGIPTLFTNAGFHKLFLGEGLPLVRTAAAERWILGPQYGGELSDAELQKLTGEVTELYLAEYVRRWQQFLGDVDVVAFRDFAHAAEVLNTLSAAESPITRFIAAVADETRLARLPGAAGGAASSGLSQIKRRLAKILKFAPSAAASLPVRDPAMVVDRRFADLNALVAGKGGTSPALDRVLAMLNDLYLHVGAVAAGGRGDAARQIAAATGGGVIERLTIEAERQPAPLGRWMRSLARESSLITLGAVSAQLNAAWATDVAPYCQSALGNRYPLARNSPEDINLNDFARYFGPSGLVDGFVGRFLKPFIDTSVRPWRKLQSGGAAVRISDPALAQLEGAARIRDAFFAGGAGPSVGFSMRATALDKSASQVLLQLGDQSIRYRHGPLRSPQRMQWPPPDGSTRARLVFTPLGSARGASLGAEGPWALFRLLDQAKVERTATPDRFKVTFSAGGLTARFDLRANSVTNPFSLAAMAKFRCLDKL